MSKELIAAIESQEALADASGELAEAREEALDHYLGKPYGNEVDGRSSVVMRDVADTVEWIKPSLMKIFASGDEVCKFDPQGPEDVQQAEQETAYCNYILNQKNNGFLILHDWFHDALLQRNGYVYVEHKIEKRPSKERYQGLSDDELALLMQGEPEVLEHEAVPTDLGVVHNITIRKLEEHGNTVICGVAPERVKVAADWDKVSLQGCPFVEIISYPTITELRQNGYDVDDDISDTGGGQENNFRMQARDESSDPEDQGADPATRRVRTRYIWMLFDYDEDGIAELRKVVIVGTTILENEETDLTPVASITPLRMPHEHNGQSIDDIVSDLQLIRTTLTRGFLDNMYLANNGRFAVDANVVSLDDMLVSRPGGLVRVNGPAQGAIVPMLHPQEGGSILQAIEYVDTVRENRTGVTKYNQGLDSQSLNKTAHGMNQIMSASQQRIELIARMFAETGVKELMLLIHAISIANGRKPEMIRLRDEWIAVDPRSWKTRFDVSVSVGLGTGDRAQQAQQLTQLLMMQKEALQIGLATPQNIYNAVVKFTQAIGYKDAESFWTDPSRQPPQPPAPNPDILKIQADKEKAQMQAQGDVQKFQAQAQLAQQADAQKLAAQTELEQQKLQSQFLMEQDRQRFEADQKERDRLLQIAIAELNKQKELEIAQMREQHAAQTAMHAAILKAQSEEKQAETANAQGQQIGQVLEAVSQIGEMINAPREIVRDPTGKAVGVSVGGKVRPIIRGPDGRVQGLQ